MDTLKNELFRNLCLKVADETDPKKIELLKQRLRIMLQETSESERDPAKGKPSTH